MKEIGKKIAWLLAVVACLFILGFAEKKQDDRTCSSIRIKIDRSNGNFFIDEEDVYAMVYHEMDTIVGRPVRDINGGRLEHKLNNHPTISRAEVFKTLNGELIIEVAQRTPIVRIFSRAGDSYYLDSTGRVMPPSSKYTSRVLVANGFVYDNFHDVNQLNAKQLPDSLKDTHLIDDIYEYAEFIRNDPFWSLQIEQLYVNKEMEVELIPRVGNHRIVFGDANDIPAKFRKLRVFYQKGLNKTGWNEYSVINLKFADQVVCTKRY